jgi:tRNA(fMet)-specific endonuclease VapC
LIAFDGDSAVLAGDIRARLEKDCNTIGPYDLMIAGHALNLKATLVTANVSEFGRVKGLLWEDWTESTVV